MPFPRFSNYTAGGTTTLYTLSDWRHQPAGVAHAEMEKWIRDAWQMYLNSWVQVGTTAITYQLANGTNATPVQLYLDSSELFNATSGVSEGHGYALLMAAQMADKNAFDSLWFWLNENSMFNNTKIYSTGNIVDAGYQYGAHVPAWAAAGSDSATDGDVDTAMGALIAWKQWGDNTGYYAAGGTGPVNTNNLPAIQYKEMALDSIRFLVALSGGPSHATAVNAWATGDVGFDGYHKSGNTWGEMTNFVAPSGTGGTCGATNGPVSQGPSTTYYDYTGPSYWHCFASTLINNGDPIDNNNTTLLWCNGTGTGNWNVSQLQKVAASDAWLQSQLTNNYTFPVAGQVSLNGTTATFTNFNEGEDFRSIWRQTLDYLLYGNPAAANTWNPTTHTIDGSTPNTAEYNAAIKIYNFFKNYATCYQPGTYQIHFNIPEMIWSNYTLAGVPMSTTDHIPYLLGSATAAVVAAANANNDFLFMERWYRELSTLWDDQVDGTGIQAGYLACYPKYFHDFFRMLGLIIITGNYVDPCNWTPKANMKIYKAVDKTYAFPNDLVTFWLNYRNYGSVNATNVTITDTIPTAFNFVSATNGGTASGQTVSWSIGTVNGLQQQNYAGTEGGVTLVVQVKSNAALGHYCNYADIACSNGTGWTSNISPNEVSYVMRRNCVDIVTAALALTKTASVAWAKPNDTITYTLNYCDSSNAGWLNGGRPGAIFSIGAENTSGANQYILFVFRGMHSASEPWIDWGNYRLSYFVYSQGQGFSLIQNRVEGTTGISVTAETLIPGCINNNTQCWDERIIMKNNASVTMPTHLLMKFFNNMPNMHYPDGDINNGGTGTNSPLLFELRLQTNPYVTTHNWALDYSSLPYTGAYSYKDAGDTNPTNWLFPIGPDWTAGDGTSVTVPQINRDSCDGANPMITNVLVEEWDGYCWRRVYGNGPQPGREVTNVVLVDSLPTNLNWGGFITTSPAGTYTAGTRTMQWNIGSMLVSQCGQVQYYAIAGGSCPSATTLSAINTAFIYADHEAPVADSAIVSINCSAPPPVPPPSSITKTANTTVYKTGDNITYTINYTNLNGTVADSSANSTILSSAANWTLDSGAANTYAAGGITLPNGAGKSRYNYSYGTNGEIMASINMTNNSSTFGVYFRSTLAFTMNVCGTGTSCAITLWNGTTALVTSNYSFNSMNVDLRIDLIGSTINIYLKDRSQTSWNVLPTISYTTAPTTAGYAGIINGDPTGSGGNGSQTFIKWYTSLDAAFNTLIYDTIPTGVSFVSASNSGAVVNGAVQWPLIAQLNYGQSIAYTWVGSVTANCTTLYNSAYAAPMGVTYSVGNQMSVSVSCGTVVPTRTNTTGPSPTLTFSPTYTGTPTATNSPTFTNSPTPTATPTNTATRTYTPTNSPTPTFTYTMTSTPSSTRTVTYTYTYTVTPTPTSTFTPTLTNTVSVTYTRTYTPTYTQTDTPTATSTYTNTMTPTPTLTRTATYTYTSTITLTDTPTSTPTLTITTSMTFTRTYTPTYTQTDTPTATPTYTNTLSPTSSLTRTATYTYTYTITLTDTPSSTPTFTITTSMTFTRTYTPTYTQTYTPTATPTYTNTLSPTSSYTQTVTYTYTYTITLTDTPTPTPTSTITTSMTFTRTYTPTYTQSDTPTATPTYTNTLSPTSSYTRTATYTYTYTITLTDTPTITSTITPTYTITMTYTVVIISATITPTYTITPTDTITKTSTPSSTNTVTYTYTYTITLTDTQTPTPTSTITTSMTFTRTYTPTYTQTDTPTATPTYTNTLSPTSSYTRTVTYTYTSTITLTDTPTFTSTSTPTYTITMTYTVVIVSATITPTYTATPTDTITKTSTPSLTSTVTYTYTYTITLTDTPTFSPTLTNTVSATYTRTSTPTYTNTATYTYTDTVTLTSTSTPTYTITMTYTVVIISATFTPTYTITPTDTITMTSTPTLTHTITYTYTYTATLTDTQTPTYTITMTFTQVILSATFTPTYTITPTDTPTYTHTMTSTPTFTPTSTYTYTYTATLTDTQTPTYTITMTFTQVILSATFTPTYTITPTDTPTYTHTMTSTPTFTPTSTYTYTYTITLTSTYTITPTYTTVIVSATFTPTYTDSPTLTATPTYTDTKTATLTYTGTVTLTYTYTVTITDTFTDTFTATPTYTDSPIDTLTSTPTYSPTMTSTYTFTNTPTDTDTRTITMTFTSTSTPTVTRTYTDTLSPTSTYTHTVTYTYTYTVTETLTRTSSPTITATYTITATPNINTPVTPSVSLSVSGDNPRLGAKITYTLVIDNTSNTTISNISIWDTLPGELSLVSISLPLVPTPTISGNYIAWNLTGTAGTLAPGQSIVVEFTVDLTSFDPAKLPVTNIMAINYNDPFYNVTKHPPVYSNNSFYPEGKPVVYPNPYNPNRAIGGMLKFENVVPGCSIQIYTISGELVSSIEAQSIIAYWDGKNRYGEKVSPGIYYFVITNPGSSAINGKIFVIYN